jgi:hypothetical protein
MKVDFQMDRRREVRQQRGWPKGGDARSWWNQWEAEKTENNTEQRATSTEGADHVSSRRNEREGTESGGKIYQVHEVAARSPDGL